METLAYLHSAQACESADAKALSLNLKAVAAVGAIGTAAITGGVVGTTESASAYGKSYFVSYRYSYRPCCRPCYYPRYYSYGHYY